MLFRYSRGDAVARIAKHFKSLLDVWEKSEELGKDVWTAEIQYTRHAWVINLDHYIRCFWLTGLALTLNIPDDQWQRLILLMGNEGEDALLDRIIATRQADRKIGTRLCFPRVYGPLMEVMQAATSERPQKLKVFLDNWFASLKIAGSPEVPPKFRTPYWWDFYANEELGMKGVYFGCWCIEAVAVVKAFWVDDSSCLDHRHYPGDLLRDGRCPRYADSDSTAMEPVVQVSEAKPLPASKLRRRGFPFKRHN
jgi:Domain of unknown function (DUF1911)/Domain of unknown function (DUF1910)